MVPAFADYGKSHCNWNRKSDDRMSCKYPVWLVERFVQKECEQMEGLQLHFEGMTVPHKGADRRAECLCVLPDKSSSPYSGAVCRSAPVRKNPASPSLFCCRLEENRGMMVPVCSSLDPPPQMMKAGRNCSVKLLELVDRLHQIYSQTRCSNLVLQENRKWLGKRSQPPAFRQDQECCLESCSSILQEADLEARQTCVRVLDLQLPG